ncbi:MAG: hypothetical protein LBT29_05605 [Flavobacteriaceae bacterium]|jgi:hypothetical protein|nr:hypothetical protein [Flavobacteriaceae bacterium]
MKTQRIIQLLQHPEILSISDKACIEQEIEKYPFTQSFYALQTKWKQHFSSENIQPDIEKLSVYSLHRNVIKNFINKPIMPTVFVQTETEILQRKEEKHEKFAENEPENKKNPDYLDSFGSLTTEGISEKKTEIPEENRTEIASQEEPVIEKKEESLKEEETHIIIENELITEENKKYPNIEKLGINYLFTGQAAPQEEDLKKPEPVKALVETLTEKIVEDPVINREFAKETTVWQENISTTEIENLVEESAENQKENLAEENIILEDIENLVEKNREILVENTVLEEVTPELEEKEDDLITTSERLTFTQWMALSNKKLQPKETVSQEEQKKIIERFIDVNPKIVPDRKDSKSIDLKKDDVKNIANLMTITLAQLYVEQGKFDTAIKAFKILSLKYPEKSSYFAKEIKKIKKLKT